MATPVKYERDIQQLTSILAMLKNEENNETEEIGLATPTPGPGPLAVLPKTIAMVLVQNCSISSKLAMEILQSCAKPSICYDHADALHGRYMSAMVSNHRQLDYVFNSLLPQLISKLCITGSLWAESIGDRGIPYTHGCEERFYVMTVL